MSEPRLDPDLFALMQCPACGGDLDERTGPHRVVCRDCGLAYPVDDGVPQMIVDAATQETAPS